MPEHKNKPSPENGMFTFTFGAGNRSEWATSLSTRGVAHMLPSLNAFTPPAPPPTITVSYYENQNQGGSESGMDAKPAHLVTPPPPLPLTISVSNYKSHKEAGMNQKPPLYHDIKASMDQVKNTDTDSLGEGNGKERIGKKEMGKDGELTLADIAKMDLPPFMKAYVQFLEQTRLAPGLEGEEVEPISPAQLRAMGQEVMSQLQQGVPQHKIRIPFVAAMDADTLPSNVRAMKTLGDLCEDSGLHEQMRLDPCDANVTETLEGRERFWGTQLLALGDELRVEQMQQEEEQDGVLEVQNGKTIEGASEKEKKRRRRPKSKRPGPQQQVESESVVDLGTKMQGLHLNTKEASAMDSGRGKQNEHQPNPIPLEPSREDIDFQMNKILSLSIELVHHTGRTEHNANAWMGGILERLKLANMLLAAFWFMPGREQNGGEEYAEMMNLIADLVGDWRSLDEEVDKKGLIGETWGDEVNGRIRAVVEKNRELVKEWLWMGVLKNEGIGGEKGPRKENMQKRSLEKEDGDELEDLESNESMEYITPTSIFGKDFRNTKVSDKKNRTRGAAKSDSQRKYSYFASPLNRSG
jgi:hypothetical protein